MSGQEWLRLMLAMGLLAALFVFPIVTIWMDERRKRRNQTPEPEEVWATLD
jgi:hypothetical protein